MVISTMRARFVDATSDSIVAAYERRIRDLEASLAIAKEKLLTSGQPPASFAELIDPPSTSSQTLGNYGIRRVSKIVAHWPNSRLQSNCRMPEMTVIEPPKHPRHSNC